VPPIIVSLPSPPSRVSLPALACQDVVGGVAGDDVVERVAGAVDRRLPVRVRFSTLAAQVGEGALDGVGPSLVSSVTMSSLLLTM